ncbi:MAG: endonuclease/exonuclease/phosphatase family protein [Chloroflexota bacterium]|nr:endonuclease/exonuclease/phosphatase family protein [Chloroflexota bacterium]
MLRIVSWNINQQRDLWQELINSDMDVALLQEAKPPSPELASLLELAHPLTWETASVLNLSYRTAIARLSDRVTMQPRKLGTIKAAQSDELAVSRMGTLAVADIVVGSTGEVITVASMYGVWESPTKDTGSSWIYADASVHRLISDLSALIGRQKGHKIIASGDLNILYGYGEHRSSYWKSRYDTIFARMAALGLPFVGPQAPDGGEQAHPWPDELPQDSKNVPTFKTRSGATTRQIDFVFASESLRNRLRVRAMNSPKEWGPSDHCRILIELEDLD